MTQVIVIIYRTPQFVSILNLFSVKYKFTFQILRFSAESRSV